MMETREDRNRALDGDIVAVKIRDEKDWVVRFELFIIK